MTGPSKILLASSYLIMLFETNESPPPRRHFELRDEDDDGAEVPPLGLRPRCAKVSTEAKTNNKMMTGFFIGQPLVMSIVAQFN